MVGFTSNLESPQARDSPKIIVFAVVPTCIGFILAAALFGSLYFPVWKLKHDCEIKIERSRSCLLVAVAEG